METGWIIVAVIRRIRCSDKAQELCLLDYISLLYLKSTLADLNAVP